MLGHELAVGEEAVVQLAVNCSRDEVLLISLCGAHFCTVMKVGGYEPSLPHLIGYSVVNIRSNCIRCTASGDTVQEVRYPLKPSDRNRVGKKPRISVIPCMYFNDPCKG